MSQRYRLLHAGPTAASTRRPASASGPALVRTSTERAIGRARDRQRRAHLFGIESWLEGGSYGAHRDKLPRLPVRAAGPSGVSDDAVSLSLRVAGPRGVTPGLRTFQVFATGTRLRRSRVRYAKPFAHRTRYETARSTCARRGVVASVWWHRRVPPGHRSLRVRVRRRSDCKET